MIERYAKVHLAGDGWATPGNHVSYFKLEGIPSTVMVCHDERYPELVRLRAIQGARIVYYISHESGLKDTIVFFFGDHGRPMPRGKQFLYDEGIRIPLIVRIPEKYRPAGFRPGSVREDLVSSIDITATTLKLAGIEPPAHMQGRPFFGAGVKPRQYVFSARDRCDETPDRIRSVRDARFKYIRNYHPERPWTQPNNYKDTAYPMLRILRDLHAAGKLAPEQARFLSARRPPEELYDLRSDPHELRNLAGEPARRETLERMRGALKEWIAATGDKGEVPERPVPVQETQYRTQVDGWCTRAFAEATKAGGAMKVACTGKSNSILRSCVAEAGEFALEFRARSATIRPNTLFWGTLDRMVYQPGRDNTAAIEFRADGSWHDYSVAFPRPAGWALSASMWVPGRERSSSIGSGLYARRPPERRSSNNGISRLEPRPRSRLAARRYPAVPLVK